MKKKLLMVAVLACLSVSAQSQIDLDQLVTASGSIVTTFDQGIQYVGGVTTATVNGQIVGVGTASESHLTYGQADAYNAALDATQQAVYTMSVQEYVDVARQDAAADFGVAVDSYIGASSVLIQAVTVNEMANDAEQSGDAVQAQNVQSYIATNNVTITDTHVDVYNDSLDAVEESGQKFAAFVAVANNAEIMSQMESEVAAAGEDFLNADSLMFVAAAEGPTVVTLFNTTSMFISFDLGMGYIDSAQIYGDGVNSEFYNTGPTGGDPCFFDPMGMECNGEMADPLVNPEP
jgi:transcription elongation factor Elf1